MGGFLSKHKDDIRAHFDAIAPTRAEWIEKNRFFYESDWRYMRFLIPEGKRVLELGCGAGELLAELRPAEQQEDQHRAPGGGEQQNGAGAQRLVRQKVEKLDEADENQQRERDHADDAVEQYSLQRASEGQAAPGQQPGANRVAADEGDEKLAEESAD